MILIHAIAAAARLLRNTADSFDEAMRLRRSMGRRFQTEE